jgi:hypothetical protein
MTGIEGMEAVGGLGQMQPPMGMEDPSGFQAALQQAQQAIGADQPMAPPVQETASLVGVPSIGKMDSERSV